MADACWRFVPSGRKRVDLDSTSAEAPSQQAIVGIGYRPLCLSSLHFEASPLLLPMPHLDGRLLNQFFLLLLFPGYVCSGQWVRSVDFGGAAHTWGLRAGDRIFSVNGVECEDGSHDDVRVIMNSHSSFGRRLARTPLCSFVRNVNFFFP